MKTTKNFLRVTLMTCSVLLLIVIQFFWLKSSYERAYFDLRRESSMLFENSVLNLRDSLFVENIETVHPDSVRQQGIGHAIRDSFSIKLRAVDSLDVRSRTQIYVSTEMVDSSADFLKPLASSVHKLEPHRSFIIRLGPDTLDVDALKLKFKKSLYVAGIDTQFRIQHYFEREPFGKGVRFKRPFGEIERQQLRPRAFSDTLTTDFVNINPLHAYAAVFSNAQATIIKEITPQILFSIILIAAIATSFFIMYRSLRSQQRLNDMKNDFISNITHELKTPVATVSVALEALKDFYVLDSPEKTKEYIGIAQSELDRLTLMTDNILKSAVFENNGVTFASENTNLHTIIEKVLLSLKPLFEKHKFDVGYKIEGSDFAINGSPLHLTNVIFNLLDNAIKYSSDGSTINISLRDAAAVVELIIQDHGMGIAKDYQKKIFEKFFRISTGDIHNVKGYGLGLSYVSHVVKKHGGTIDVDSEPGKGCAFILRLPKNQLSVPL